MDVIPPATWSPATWSPATLPQDAASGTGSDSTTYNNPYTIWPNNAAQPSQIYSPQWSPSPTWVSVSADQPAPEKKVTIEHVKESLAKGGLIVGGALGILVGPALLATKLLGVHPVLAAAIEVLVLSLVGLSYVIGDRIVTKENQFLEKTLLRMAEPGVKQDVGNSSWASAYHPTVSSITPTSATLSWTTTSGPQSHTATGLTPNTSYSIRVRASRGGV